MDGYRMTMMVNWCLVVVLKQAVEVNGLKVSPQLGAAQMYRS